MSTGSHETLKPGDQVIVWRNDKWGMKGVYEGPAQADSRRVIVRDPQTGIGFDVMPEQVQKIQGTGE